MPALTWQDRVRNLIAALGREPTLEELLLLSPLHKMTEEELAAQRESFARAMAPCEHGVADFEECEKCRQK